MTAQSDRASTTAFLTALFDPFDDGLDGSIVCINAARKDIPSRFARNIDSAVEFLHADENASVSFFGTCTQSEDDARMLSREAGRNPAYARGGIASTRAMPGLWLDVDCGSAGHTKSDLPPSVGAAWGVLIDAMPLPPTVRASTGGGMHLYWLFSEGCVTFDNVDQTRDALGDLMIAWQQIARDAFARHGWSLDTTHDLARSLRPPGTLNAKYRPARKVTWLETGRRYSVDELQQTIPDDQWQQAKAVRAKRNVTREYLAGQEGSDLSGLDLGLSSDRMHDAGKIVQALCEGMEGVEGDAALAHRWAHRSTGNRGAELSRMTDVSQSAFDLAIATRLMRLGAMTDEQIVDALRLHRTLKTSPARKAAAGTIETKLARTDYYLDRLALAREHSDKAAANDAELAEIDAVLGELDLGAPGPATPQVAAEASDELESGPDDEFPWEDGVGVIEADAITPTPSVPGCSPARANDDDPGDSGSSSGPPVTPRAASGADCGAVDPAAAKARQRALGAVSAAIGKDGGGQPFISRVRVRPGPRGLEFAISFTARPTDVPWEVPGPLGAAERHLRMAICDASTVLLPPFKAERWALVVKALMHAAEPWSEELEDGDGTALLVAQWVQRCVVEDDTGGGDPGERRILGVRTPQWHDALRRQEGGLVYVNAHNPADHGALVPTSALAAFLISPDGPCRCFELSPREARASAVARLGLKRRRIASVMPDDPGRAQSVQGYTFAPLELITEVLGAGAWRLDVAVTEGIRRGAEYKKSGGNFGGSDDSSTGLGEGAES